MTSPCLLVMWMWSESTATNDQQVAKKWSEAWRLAQPTGLGPPKMPNRDLETAEF